MDIREYYPLEQHDFVEFSRQEQLTEFTRTAVMMMASTGKYDVKELINTLANISFAGEADKRSSESAEMAAELQNIVAKSYKIQTVGGAGVLEVSDA